MSFNSFPFLIFILLFFILWRFFKDKKNAKYFFLIVSSFLFYGWWDWRFLFLIIFSGLVDFLTAKKINTNPEWRKQLLVISIIVNLGILVIFKYSSFITEQLELFLRLFIPNIELKSQLPAFSYILPVGISFYTFQSMSYTIDVYRGKLKPTNNILHFFAYLVMFPQLVAGPIVRAKDFLYQLKLNRKISGIEFWNGIKLILLGYFQKTVLADNLGVFVDSAFAGVNNGIGLYWWVALFCFAFQIYFDFNGYTQIARGLAKLMGYHFRMNFNHPYMAVSLKDFWARWHISLSTWFRDYVYIPLGGSKKGTLRTHYNIWITMILSGLWHGAQINFILWGAYHGFALSLERIFNKIFKKKEIVLPSILKWSLTLFIVLIGWLFFRATSMEQIHQIIKELFTMNFSTQFMLSYKDPMLFLIIAFLYEGLYPIVKRNKTIRKIFQNQYLEAALFAVVISAILFFRGPEKEFIYFQF